MAVEGSPPIVSRFKKIGLHPWIGVRYGTNGNGYNPKEKDPHLLPKVKKFSTYVGTNGGDNGKATVTTESETATNVQAK